MPSVFIGVGHGGGDVGASSQGYVEKSINLVKALECANILESHGVSVKLSRVKDEDDDLREEIRECNAFNPHIAIDIHTNAGGGDGFECYHSKGDSEGERLGKLIEKEVIAIGQNSRGVKTKLNSQGKDYYGFIRETRPTALILEGFFLDSVDRGIGDTVEEQKAFGRAYARGLLTYFGIAYKEDKPKIETGKMYYVQVGAYGVKDNAVKMFERLKADGYPAYIKEE